MTEESFISLIEEVLEVDPGSVALGSTLEDLDWDSLSNLSLIAMLDSEHNINIGAQALQEAKTVKDLYSLISG